MSEAAVRNNPAAARRISRDDPHAPHMTWAEVAARIGCTEKAARQAHCAAMKKLRTQIDRLGWFREFAGGVND